MLHLCRRKDSSETSSRRATIDLAGLGSWRHPRRSARVREMEKGEAWRARGAAASRGRRAEVGVSYKSIFSNSASSLNVGGCNVRMFNLYCTIPYSTLTPQVMGSVRLYGGFGSGAVPALKRLYDILMLL